MINNINAEKIFLQLLLNNLHDYLDKVNENYFSTQETQETYKAIQKLYINNKPINDALLKELNVESDWLFNKAKGDIETYYQIIQSQYIKRELNAYGLKLKDDVKNKTSDQLVLDNQALLLKLTSNKETITKDPIKTAIEAAKTSFLARQQKGLPGISLINNDLNEMTGGLGKKELSVLAGRPSVGKTLYADNILENHSFNDNIHSLMISLEMPSEIVGQRIICSKLDINLHNLNTGYLSREDLGKLYAPLNCRDCGCAKIITKVEYESYSVNGTCSECGNNNIRYKIDEIQEQSKMLIDDRPSLSITQILMCIKSYKIQYPDLDLVLIDYMDEIGWAPGESLVQKYGNICKMLRNLARQLDIHIMILSQLNRDLEKEERPPAMHDLRASGEIEQVADKIFLLHRDRVNSPDVLSINLVKQRNGPTGTVNAKLNAKTQRVFKDSIVI